MFLLGFSVRIKRRDTNKELSLDKRGPAAEEK